MEAMIVGTVRELWRYPVKSLGGERLEELRFDEWGAINDRAWALVRNDGRIASGKDTRRFAAVEDLLTHGSRLSADGSPLVELSDGRNVAPNDDTALEIAGPGWHFAREGLTPHKDAGAVHLLTTESLRSLGEFVGEVVEVERLRPNLLIEAGELREEDWIGQFLMVGEIVIGVAGSTERCVMVGQRQRRLPERRLLLRSIGQWNSVNAGIYASVVKPGVVRTGDAVHLVENYEEPLSA